MNSGNGFLFISHTGEVYPSGFLPISAGNVRGNTLTKIYRESELFLSLRRPEGFRGVCGVCEFNAICGGSRSRALALTGDYLERITLLGLARPGNTNETRQFEVRGLFSLNRIADVPTLTTIP